MSKPIFIMRIPKETINTIGRDRLEIIAQSLQLRLDDYHVLVMVDNHVREAQFQCFNADNVPAVGIEELKSMCMQTFRTSTENAE